MDLSSTKVFLQKCQSYEETQLYVTLDEILRSCIQNQNLRSARILLKPNLITARMGSLACTATEFMLVSAKWFLDQGAHVSIGDSPAFGTATSVLNKLGIVEKLRKLPITITNFNNAKNVTLSSGIVASLAVDALDCDLLVNMPKVKAHAQLRVSLAIKNLFGCLVGMRKPWWHMKYGGCNGGFSDHLVEILPALPASLTLVDGVTAMHKTGPITGKPFSLGIVGCSSNPVAVDRAILEMIGLRPELYPLMVSCIEKGLVGTDIDELEFPLLKPSELSAESFVVPEVLHPIRFNPFRFLRGNIKRIFHRLGLFS